MKSERIVFDMGGEMDELMECYHGMSRKAINAFKHCHPVQKGKKNNGSGKTYWNEEYRKLRDQIFTDLKDM